MVSSWISHELLLSTKRTERDIKDNCDCDCRKNVAYTISGKPCFVSWTAYVVQFVLCELQHRLCICWDYTSLLYAVISRICSYFVNHGNEWGIALHLVQWEEEIEMLERFCLFVCFFTPCFCLLHGYVKTKESISVTPFIILTDLLLWTKFRMSCFATISVDNSELLICILYSVAIFIDRNKLMVASTVVSIFNHLELQDYNENKFAISVWIN